MSFTSGKSCCSPAVISCCTFSERMRRSQLKNVVQISFLLLSVLSWLAECCFNKRNCHTKAGASRAKSQYRYWKSLLRRLHNLVCSNYCFGKSMSRLNMHVITLKWLTVKRCLGKCAIISPEQFLSTPGCFHNLSTGEKPEESETNCVIWLNYLV